jgi:hypothetical protein
LSWAGSVVYEGRNAGHLWLSVAVSLVLFLLILGALNAFGRFVVYPYLCNGGVYPRLRLIASWLLCVLVFVVMIAAHGIVPVLFKKFCAN